jgi:hypothetical protein
MAWRKSISENKHRVMAWRKSIAASLRAAPAKQRRQQAAGVISIAAWRNQSIRHGLTRWRQALRYMK